MDDLALPLECGLLPVPIHPAIDHALSAFDAASARAAGHACMVALAERLAASDDPWSGSRLTGDGLPFEISFCTADDRVRFTAEPGARSLAAGERLEAAARVVDWLGAPAIPLEVLRGLRSMQAGHELGFGAWIGCRAGAKGITTKVYVEVPDAVPFGARSVDPGVRGIAPRIVAYLPSSGTFEVYLRARKASPGELPALLASGGLEREGASALEYIELIHGHRLRDRLPGPVGVSYAWPKAGHVTLHFYARALWGPDAAIRRDFSRAGRALGWDDAPYLRATQAIAERNEWRTCHGLVGLTLDAAGTRALTIGLRPVAP